MDAGLTTLPVVIIHPSGHLGAMNSEGMERTGYSAATKDPLSGANQRKPGSQKPEDLVEEAACFGSAARSTSSKRACQADRTSSVSRQVGCPVTA
jgi:predicted amidohydrolase YtcJ